MAARIAQSPETGGLTALRP